MTDIVLIHPGAQHGIYGPLGDTLTALEPPTWVRLVGGWLRDRGYKVAIVDQEAERLDPDVVAERVRALRPSLICIVVAGHQPSASTQQMTGARAVAQALRSLAIPVAMSGNHPSALPVQTLEEEPVDYVIDGEGPVTLKALLDGVRLREVPGLVWRASAAEIVQNPRAPLIPIDELHGDVWDLLPMDKYRGHQWQCFDDLSKRQPYASIYTTLGCPFACGFCMINVFQHTNRYRRRDPMKVVDQIEMLYRDYGVQTIKIADELFVLTPAHYVAICEEIIRRGLGDKLNFWAYCRIDGVKPEFLSLLRRAGIRWLALGIESASGEVRDGASKDFKGNDIASVVKQVQDAGIYVIGNFIFGLRHETHETMQETLDLAMRCMPEFANMYVAMPYPGSKLYDEAKVNGWPMPKTWRGYSQHNDDTYPMGSEFLKPAEVLAFRDQAFLTYFTNPAYLDMVEKKFGAETLAHVKEMTKYRLTRKLLTGEIE